MNGCKKESSVKFNWIFILYILSVVTISIVLSWFVFPGRPDTEIPLNFSQIPYNATSDGYLWKNDAAVMSPTNIIEKFFSLNLDQDWYDVCIYNGIQVQTFANKEALREDQRLASTPTSIVYELNPVENPGEALLMQLDIFPFRENLDLYRQSEFLAYWNKFLSPPSPKGKLGEYMRISSTIKAFPGEIDCTPLKLSSEGFYFMHPFFGNVGFPLGTYPNGTQGIGPMYENIAGTLSKVQFGDTKIYLRTNTKSLWISRALFVFVFVLIGKFLWELKEKCIVRRPKK